MNLDHSDILGQNIGFFRQWKLSEVDLKGNQIMMKRNKSLNCYFPRIKGDSENPYKPEIPIWSAQPTTEGYVEWSSLNELSNNNGGTAVIVWETKEHEILFLDIHSSINDIIECARKVGREYGIDPTIGVFDAAPMARKFKSDLGNVVRFKDVDPKISKIGYVGAGYAYNVNPRYKLPDNK